MAVRWRRRRAPMRALIAPTSLKEWRSAAHHRGSDALALALGGLSLVMLGALAFFATVGVGR